MATKNESGKNESTAGAADVEQPKSAAQQAAEAGPDESVEAAKEAGADQVQERFDEAEEQGFFGQSPDQTPRDNYTVEGVGSDAPTPENPSGK